MNDEINKNPLPRVIKGTGFFTPMDLAPGETLAPAAPSSDPAASTQPTAPASAPAAQEPPQPDSSSNGADN